MKKTERNLTSILIILFVIFLVQMNYYELPKNDQIDMPKEINNPTKKNINVDSIIKAVLKEVNDTIKIKKN